MSKTVKRYQLLKGFQLMMFVLVNGKQVTVTFQNGMRKPTLIRGRFSTDNLELQEALEADSGFNKEFYLEHTDYPEGEPEQNIIGAGTEIVPPEGEPVQKPVADGKVPEDLPDPDKTLTPEEPQQGDTVASDKPAETPEQDKTPEEPQHNVGSEDVTPDTPSTDREEPQQPSGPIDYPEVTNLQEARQKLFDLFPGVYKPANLPNLKAVINRAKDMNITFSKLTLK